MMRLYVLIHIVIATIIWPSFGEQKSSLSNQTNTCASKYDCPAWTNCTSEKCHCIQESFKNDTLKCSDGKLSVLSCTCLTYNNVSLGADIVYGSCVMNCIHWLHGDLMYHPTFSPNRTNNVTEIMCGRHNRAGRLCGQCLPGYSPQAYSYNLTCVQCPEGNRNLWKYFLMAILPLTCFYFIIIFFKINTTSSYLHGYILFAHGLSHPVLGRILTLMLEASPNSTSNVIVDIAFSFYTVWNLDFFRIVNMKICLDLTPLSVRALDYTIAVYPFFLTVISYILIELHGRNYRLLVWIWKPFRCIFTHFRRNWDIRTSVIDAYATLYLLIFMKILCLSFDFLSMTYAYTLGRTESKPVLYYDGSVDYFGPEHLPFAILALVIAFLFVIFPILLLLVYPCRCFQYVINKGNSSYHILKTFMDSFQGCYKDGTVQGEKDCRWFAAVHLFYRVLLCILYAITLNDLFFPLACIVLQLMILMLLSIQPYSKRVVQYTVIDASFYGLLSIVYASLGAATLAGTKMLGFLKYFLMLSAIVTVIPLIYISCLTIHWLYSNRKWGRTLIDRLRAWWRGYDLLEESEESLPDRLQNPDQYPEQCLEEAASGDISAANRD